MRTRANWVPLHGDRSLPTRVTHWAGYLKFYPMRNVRSAAVDSPSSAHPSAQVRWPFNHHPNHLSAAFLVRFLGGPEWFGSSRRILATPIDGRGPQAIRCRPASRDARCRSGQTIFSAQVFCNRCDAVGGRGRGGGVDERASGDRRMTQRGETHRAWRRGAGGLGGEQGGAGAAAVQPGVGVGARGFVPVAGPHGSPPPRRGPAGPLRAAPREDPRAAGPALGARRLRHLPRAARVRPLAQPCKIRRRGAR
jgi:hypothetical protein